MPGAQHRAWSTIGPQTCWLKKFCLPATPTFYSDPFLSSDPCSLQDNPSSSDPNSPRPGHPTVESLGAGLPDSDSTGLSLVSPLSSSPWEVTETLWPGVPVGKSRRGHPTWPEPHLDQTENEAAVTMTLVPPVTPIPSHPLLWLCRVSHILLSLGHRLSSLRVSPETKLWPTPRDPEPKL